MPVTRQARQRWSAALPGMGDFIEVGSPILAGVAGAVHIGMDTGLIALKIQRAIGQQVYLICTIFIVGVFAAIWFVNYAAKPVDGLVTYAVGLAREQSTDDAASEKLLARKDEAGDLARLFLHFSRLSDDQGAERPSGPDRGKE